jgi:hypothetical protein
VSFASEPERDDGSLPPVDIEIPDDARELARDVIAYHREQRARRRRERMTRALRPLVRAGMIRHGTVFPLIATFVALSMIAGALLSVAAVGPAFAPVTAAGQRHLSSLPQDTVMLDGGLVPVSTLDGSVLVLIPATCGCGPVLSGVAKQAASAHVAVYFVYRAGSAGGLSRLTTLTTEYGDRVARTVYDISDGLFFAFGEPTTPVALLAASTGTVDVYRTFPPGFDLSPALGSLKRTH